MVCHAARHAFPRLRSHSLAAPQLITAKDKGGGSKGFYNVLKSSEKAEAHIKQLEMQRASLERQVTAAEVRLRRVTNGLELPISTAGRPTAHALMINWM